MNHGTAIETEFKGYKFHSKDLPQPAQKMMARRADRAGQTFGRLRVIEELGSAGGGYRWWGCECTCGSRVAVRSRELDRGHTQSCGCLQREVARRSAGRNKLPCGHASRNELLASYKKSSRDRGIAWALSDAEFVSIIAEPCTYCRTPASRERKPNAGVNGGFFYSGIDRVDNADGYIAGNVVPCCWDCNRAKGTLGLVDFLAWADRLAAARFEHGANGL